LVNTVSIDGKGTQNYTYGADGTKLGFKQGNDVKVKSYIGAVEYDGEGKILRIGTEEGYILKRTGWNENSKDSKFVYYYSVKDHLGNVRLVLDDESNAKLWQRNDYQAFGMHINQPVDGVPTPDLMGINDRYYNGKEFDDQTTWLDYGARQYDYSLGRWMAVDPKSEKYYSWSPYHTVFDNPLKFIDPDGKGPEKPSHYLIGLISDYWQRKPIDNILAENFNAIGRNAEDNALRYLGHGNSHHITVAVSKGVYNRYQADAIDGYLTNSDEGKHWIDMKENGGTFISYACESGVEGGVISQASGLKENAKVIFVAPTEYTHPGKEPSKGLSYTFNSKTKAGGTWNIYQGGKLIGNRPNGWQPTEIDPKTFKDVPKPPSRTERLINLVNEFFKKLMQ
jgi:RHS repeat-associated protein